MTVPIATREQTYLEVLQYYARQMQCLDDGDLAGYAATFTEDGEFSHTPGRPPARTRAGILDDLVEFHRRFEADPMRRRHHFSMVDIDHGDGDGATLTATAYALVVAQRPGAAPEVRASCVVHDVLVRDADGGLRNRSRLVQYD
jgi:actinorhodin biosynthesis protein ActVIA